MPKSKNTKWFVIINPASSGGKGEQRWEAIQQRLHQYKLDFAFEKTMHQNHATQITQDAILQGFRKIIAVGGDGTGNEVANGILQQDVVPSSEIIFSILPIGTGNDWIKTYGIPKQLDSWIEYLKKGKTTIQDVGLVECVVEDKRVQRYFINVAGMAYDAFAVKLSQGEKNFIFPKVQYLLLVLKGLFKYQLHRAKLIFDDREVVDFFYTINIGICKYSGGGMQLVPHAIPNDGQLALTYAGQLSKLNIILNSYRFYNGTILNHPKVEGFFTKKIKVETMNNQPTGVEVDGEYVGETPVEFTIIPQALKVVIP